MIGNVNLGPLANIRAATLERLANGPGIVAQSQSLRTQAATRREPAMSAREAERIWDNRKAKAERNDREHRSAMRRLSGEEDTFVQLPRVSPEIHDEASVFVQAQFGPIDREARRERQQEVNDSALAHFTRGGRLMMIF